MAFGLCMFEATEACACKHYGMVWMASGEALQARCLQDSVAAQLLVFVSTTAATQRGALCEL